MAEQNKKMSPAEINRRIKQEMDAMRRKYKKQGMDDMEIESLMRDFFVEKKTPAKKTMTAAKGGVAKKKKPAFVSIAKQKEFSRKLRELEKLGRSLGIEGPNPKMMRGGAVAKKKMRGGGMMKVAAKKKMMRGGVAKKK